MQLAGIITERKQNYEHLKELEVKVNNFDDVDVSIGNIGFEVEHAGSHNLQEIIDKKQRGLLKYKTVLFIGSKANEAVLIEGAGKDFVVRRGKQLDLWINEHLIDALDSPYFTVQDNDLKISEDLAIEAI